MKKRLALAYRPYPRSLLIAASIRRALLLPRAGT